MASELRDAAKPRRFDLTMSRRTRRPASSATNCHQEDPVQPQQQDQDAELTPECLRLSDHLQPRQCQDAHQEHNTSVEEQTPPQKCLEKDGESEAQQQQDCEADNSRRFSLQELIEDEAVGGVKDAATGSPEENAAVAVHEVAEAAAAGAARPPEQVAGRRVIGMVRRYVKVRPIKPKRAPEKNVAPVC